MQRLRTMLRRRRSPAFLLVLICLSSSANGDDRTPANSNWPGWRGPHGTGMAPLANPPIRWNETENIRWKVPLPGKGHSTPIVWSNRVYLTTSVPVGKPIKPIPSTAPGAHDNLPVTHSQKFVVIALKRSDGSRLWERTLQTELPQEAGHYTGSLASNSPVTDGEHLFAFFGSYGLYCLDPTGAVVWEKDLGQMQSKHGHGEGSSPALHGETLIITWDHEGGSFVVAYNKRTGKQKWKVEREEVTSWATPIVIEHAGETQVIVNGTNRIRGYDLHDGKILWECGGMSANIVASPVFANGIVYAGSSYEKRVFLAIRIDGAHGDLTGTDHVIWSRQRGTPYVPSPLLYDNTLYFLAHYQGILSRINARTGNDEPGLLRLSGLRDIYASPVAAAGRVYITDRTGATLVMTHDVAPKALGLNRLDESISASAALVDRELYLRGEEHLYCIAEDHSAE